MSFTHFHLHPSILDGVRDAGYDTPTPIQKAAIPVAITGRDLIGLAQTGTGKTAAFVLPLLHRLLEGPRGPIRMLVIAPTRELAEQINEAIRSLGAHTGLRSAVIYGGVNINPQVNALKGNLDVVVACPGRLLDHLGRRTVNLSKVTTLVIDEADRMLDMGFLPDVRRVLKHLPKERQTLLFSATMPAEVRQLAQEFLVSPETIQVGTLKPIHTVSHALYPVPQHLKTSLLLEILKRVGTESVIVFTKTKHRAKKVAQQLEAARHPATSLQGNLSQNRRQEAIEGFRDGSYKIMVATDIASRGIDVSQISHVINYDIPDTADAYTHRIGRTGRVERTGDAFTFVTGDDELMVRAIERVLGETIERRRLEGFDYHAPAPPKTPSAPQGQRHRPAARTAGTPAREKTASRPRAAVPRQPTDGKRGGGPDGNRAGAPPSRPRSGSVRGPGAGPSGTAGGRKSPSRWSGGSSGTARRDSGAGGPAANRGRSSFRGPGSRPGGRPTSGGGGDRDGNR